MWLCAGSWHGAPGFPPVVVVVGGGSGGGQGQSLTNKETIYI